jgi:dipeptidyl aminopeptidase/acylaminoacyl peptidase
VDRGIPGFDVRRPLIALAAVSGLVVVTYLGVSAAAWDQITTVDGSCLASRTSQTPANFVGAWDQETGPFVDAGPFHFDAKDVSFPSLTPGLTLRAWWAKPRDGEDQVVIVVHGKNSCRRDATSLLPAGMLARAGFGVLVPDLRDHGESDREDGHWAGGTDEWQDVLGAWQWLRDQGYPADRIGLYGGSMGAGSVSMAMGREPAVAAAFLDSPYANILEASTFYARANDRPAWLVPGALFMGGIIGGDDLLGASPADYFRTRLAGRPVFIVHGTADSTIDVGQGIALAKAAGEGGTVVEPWILDGAEHVQAVFVDPGTYEQRLTGFFSAALR